jgi:hypothetical protein
MTYPPAPTGTIPCDGCGTPTGPIARCFIRADGTRVGYLCPDCEQRERARVTP